LIQTNQLLVGEFTELFHYAFVFGLA